MRQTKYQSHLITLWFLSLFASCSLVTPVLLLVEWLMLTAACSDESKAGLERYRAMWSRVSAWQSLFFDVHRSIPWIILRVVEMLAV
jgi:hypothetical protein